MSLQDTYEQLDDFFCSFVEAMILGDPEEVKLAAELVGV